VLNFVDVDCFVVPDVVSVVVAVDAVFVSG
jgi:hypothetical protein